MPLFDFKCASCGQRFEVLLGADERACCPRCGSWELKQELSAPGRVGVATPGDGLQCGKTTACCGASETCGKPGCHK